MTGMADRTFDEMIQQVDQLTSEERQALIVHLQECAKHRELSFEEWVILFDSIKINIPAGPNFSDRREDWYDENGR